MVHSRLGQRRLIPIRRAIRRTNPILLLIITLSAGILVFTPNQIPAAHALPAAARTIGLGIYNSGWNDGVNPANSPLAVYNGTSVTMFLVNGNGARHQFRINTSPAITSPVLRSDTAPMIFGFTASPVGTFTYCDVYNATACGTFQIKTLGDVNGDSVVNNVDLSSVTSYNGTSLSSTWNSGDVPYLHGVVDYTDLYVVAYYFGTTGPWPSPYHPDINGDGIVNIYDLTTVGGQFGHVAPAPFNNPNQGPDINYDNAVNNADIATVIANGADTRATNDASHKSHLETSVSSNPNDPNNAAAVAMDYRDGVRACTPLRGCEALPWFYIYMTFNGGLSWTNLRLPGGPKNATAVLPASYTSLNDPTVAFDTTDHFFIAGLITTGTQNMNPLIVSRYRVNRSLSTVTYEQTVIADPAASPSNLDKPVVTVDQASSNVYVAYWDLNTGSNEAILMAHSADLGNTFHSAVVERGPQLGENGLTVTPWATAAVVPGGKVYIAYFEGFHQIRIAGSTDGGVTFTSPSPTKAVDVLRRNTELSNILPTITPSLSFTANPVSGDLYLVWEDYRNNATRGADIMFSSSTNGGVTWTAPVTVNDDGTAADQFFPVVVAGGRVSGDHDVSVIFYDRRLNSQSSSSIDVFYARSVDGGAHWLPNKRVTDVSFDSNFKITGSTGDFDQYFIGDYIGLAASTRSDDTIVVRAAWTDTRLSVQDIFSDVRSFKAGLTN